MLYLHSNERWLNQEPNAKGINLIE